MATPSEEREERRQVEELYRFLMVPPAPGAPTRAQMIDDALNGLNAGKFVARALLWLFGFVIAAAAAIQVIKGWKP